MIGPAIFAGTLLALTVAQYDFMLGIGWRPLTDPANAWPSGLALGPYGWLLDATFATCGVLLIVFAIGMHRGLAQGSKLGPALLGISGGAMALLAFETDPIDRPPHSPRHHPRRLVRHVRRGAAARAARSQASHGKRTQPA